MATRQRNAPATRADAYAEVTARIVAALERGTVPWRQPWRSRGHRNAVTRRVYRGINPLLLGLTAIERGFSDPRWLTFRQTLANGGHVRRGERGTHVVLWRWVDRRDRDTDEVAQRFPLLRLFTVFNVAQCDNLDLAPEGRTEFDPITRGEAIVAGYHAGPTVLHGAEQAYYIASRDEVHLPTREAFASADAYYATLFHELAHSTGHPARLNREGFEREVAPFGSERYSREELVAEFAAAFLCCEAGIDASRLEQSAAYIANWLHALRDDRRLAVVAAAQGQRAADHVLGWAPEDSPVTTEQED